jgi:pectinesterase
MAKGWSNWNNTDNYKTTRFSEYKNYGPGSNISARIDWAKQIAEEAARSITIKKVFRGWNPMIEKEH